MEKSDIGKTDIDGFVKLKFELTPPKLRNKFQNKIKKKRNRSRSRSP